MPTSIADVRDRVVPRGQHELCLVEAGLDPVQVRRDTEQGFELADEVKGRDADFAGDFPGRQRALSVSCQQISGAAESRQRVAVQSHDGLFSMRCNVVVWYVTAVAPVTNDLCR